MRPTNKVFCVKGDRCQHLICSSYSCIIKWNNIAKFSFTCVVKCYSMNTGKITASYDKQSRQLQHVLITWTHTFFNSHENRSVSFTVCGLLVIGKFEPQQTKSKKMLWEVNFSSRFCSDRMKLLQVWVYTRCFHLWKTTSWTKLSNPAHTAAGAPESLFTSSLYFSLRSSSLCSSCYCSLSLSLSCLCPCRSQVALCASLPKHRWHSGCLQEKANEVSCQSKIWLLIWPLQQGTAEEEEDQCTCLQLLTSDHVTVC